MRDSLHKFGSYLKDKSKIYINLTILVPGIFAGISLLSFIVAVRVSEHEFLSHGGQKLRDLLIWGVLLSVVTFLLGFLIMRLLLMPIKKFMKDTEQLPVFPEINTAGKKNSRMDEIEHLNFVLRGVAEILSKVEARQLFPEIIGESNLMRGLFREILKVSPTDATILITGESGTGKELIATSIYNHSLRRDKPFVKLNCVAIPAGLLESELFGHEKGSFTGAVGTKIGKFELANGGSIMLDEIGDMPLDTQAKLLRVLQEREFERVGGNRSIKVDVRFIAASNQDLDSMVKEGKFRSDLFYRLNVISLKVPPLRERREDIPLLVNYFLQNTGKQVRISPLVLNYLMMYSWPGNVRELQNTIERASLTAESGVIEPANLPTNILASLAAQGIEVSLSDKIGKIVNLERSGMISSEGELRKNSNVRDTGEIDLVNEERSIDKHLESIERKMIENALINTQGVQSKAARLLGIKERSLWHRVKKYKIDINSLRKV